MKYFTEAIKSGLNAYRHRDQYTYLYGCKGQYLDSRQTILNYMNAEPGYFSRYSDSEKEQIIRNSLHKKGLDCSAFTGLCTGDNQWSTGQINNCKKITTPREGVAGSILYTTWGGKGRHIGLDIGYGYCLDTGYESTDAVVARGDHSIRLTRIAETAWEKSGQSKMLDYTGATNV